MYEKKNKKKKRKSKLYKKYNLKEEFTSSHFDSLYSNINETNLTIFSDILRDKDLQIIFNLSYNKQLIYNLFIFNYQVFYLKIKFFSLKKIYLSRDLKINSTRTDISKINKVIKSMTLKNNGMIHLRYYYKNHISYKYNSLFQQFRYRLRTSYYF